MQTLNPPKTNPMNCNQLDVYDRFKIRIDENGRIIFADDNFLRFTGMEIDDIVGEDFSTLLTGEFQNGHYQDILFPVMKDKNKLYFIMSGRTKDGNCYWALVRSTHYRGVDGSGPKFLWELKMLPQSVIPQLKELFDKLVEITNNAGHEYAIKYFMGYMEDKGISFDQIATSMLGTKEKKLDKYFKI